MATAAQKVECVPELLEMILYELDPRDMLIYTRVNKHWKRTIDGSKRIRKAMFLEPATSYPLDHIFYIFDMGGHGFGNESLSPNPQKLYFNPLFKPLLDAIKEDERWHGDDIGKGTVPAITFESLLNDLPASWRAEEASWRSMYATQPPCTETWIVANYELEDEKRYRISNTQAKSEVKVAGGVKGEHIAQMVETFAEEMNVKLRELLESAYDADGNPIKESRMGSVGPVDRLMVRCHSLLQDRDILRWEHHEILEELPMPKFELCRMERCYCCSCGTVLDFKEKELRARCRNDSELGGDSQLDPWSRFLLAKHDHPVLG